jgi:ornithine cyclodeaminase/alanine dehydrogenase-like protein (mu-crystallin family)
MTLLVPEGQLREHVSMRACIDAVERAFAAAGRGHMELLPRRVVSAGAGARLHSLAAASDELGYVFSLTYSGTPAGANKNTTSVNRRQKIFTLFDAATGACVAILGGRYLSWLNTGAMGAVAIRHLSAPDATSLAVIGSGRQARAALLGALEVRSLTDVRVWSRNPANARALVAEFPAIRGLRAVADVRDAVRDVEIVTTVTTAHEPVVLGEWLADGVHVNSIGAHYPDRREVDTAAVVGSTVFVDTMTTAAAEKGELLIPQVEGVFSLDDVCAELGSVVAGRTQWRRHPGERTLYASCGSAVEAFGAAVGALERVRGMDLPEVHFE